MDFLDTTGTLFSMANFINNYVPGAPCPSFSVKTLCANYNVLLFSGLDHRSALLYSVALHLPSVHP